MPGPRHVAVIDIGKTNAKVAVVDLGRRRELGVLTRPNTVLPGPPYPHYDVDGLWGFIGASLGRLHGEHRIDAISVTTHGASAALLDAAGDLAAPVLDYEHPGPDDLAAEYDAIRPAFAETGSPRLGMGLNVGAQLFWQLRADPGLAPRLATVLTYPQYWAYRLTGRVANEVTSLGCHTDLWCPAERRYSSLVGRLGLDSKMPPVETAAACRAGLRSEVAREIGLPAGLPVACGIHDSNASLYPHLLARAAPFAVVSTGTWVIALAIGGEDVPLDPARDTLINVNAFGDPVRSARFMGGREFDLMLGEGARDYGKAEVARVVDDAVMLFPAVETRSGPFQGRRHHWSVEEDQLSDGERFAAVSFYLALMTAECLAMTGARGAIVVEGPFAQNRLFLDMLRAATGRGVEAPAGSLTGTSIGAALLLSRAAAQAPQRTATSGTSAHMDPPPGYAAYAQRWRSALGIA